MSTGVAKMIVLAVLLSAGVCICMPAQLIRATAADRRIQQSTRRCKNFRDRPAGRIAGNSEETD